MAVFASQSYLGAPELVSLTRKRVRSLADTSPDRQRLTRDVMMLQLADMGWSYNEIADAFSLHRSHVGRRLEALYRRRREVKLAE